MCGVSLQAEKMQTILKAANVQLEPFWPALFAKTLSASGIKVKELLAGAAAGSHSTAGAAAGAQPPAAAAGLSPSALPSSPLPLPLSLDSISFVDTL